MKKKTLTLALCAVMMLSVTACGGKKDEVSSSSSASMATESSVSKESSVVGTESSAALESSSDESSATPESSAAGSATSKTDAASLGVFASVEEFAASEEIQSQIETMKASLNEAGMDIAVTGEGDKLIYTYTYQELTDEDGTMADAIKTQMDAQASTFTTVANSIKAAVDVENPVVVVRYLDANGEEIFSGEYPAE